jgi:hypothetical protein
MICCMKCSQATLAPTIQVHATLLTMKQRGTEGALKGSAEDQKRYNIST